MTTSKTIPVCLETHRAGDGPRRRTLTVVASLAFALISGIAPPARADYQQAQDILEGGTIGGTRGLRVRRVGAAAPAFSLNGGFVYYPASSIKILEHFYAMTRVQAGVWTLNGTTAAVCPSGSDNCGNVLNTQSGCGAVAQPMSTVLSAMMVSSSNAATNAVQERVGQTYFPAINPWIFQMPVLGRAAINQFASVSVGMTNSAINHKFGCQGFCGNPSPNALTLIDAERLYKSIATDGALLSPALRLQLHDLMLNESNTFLNDIIDQEAAATGKNAWKEDFKDQFFEIYKAGSWNCSGKTYRSSSGLVQLPTYNGAYKQLYTWGGFTHDSEQWAYLPSTVTNAVKEMLRAPIRAALLTWGFGYAAAEQVGQAGVQIGQLPSQGSPAQSLLKDAAVLARRASSELDREHRDYVIAFDLLTATVDSLEAARRLDPRLVPEDLVRQLLAASRAAATDVMALVTMTGNATSMAEAISQVQQRITAGTALSGRGEYAAAVRELAAAAARGNPLIVWDASRTPVDDRTVGFFGATAPRAVSAFSVVE